MQRTTTRGWALTALASAMAAGMLPNRALGAGAALRVAGLPFDGTALAYYAKDGGFFDRAALDVEMETMASGPAIMAAVAGGSVDIGVADLVALSYAHTKGLPFTIVSPGGLYTAKTPTDALLVPQASPVRTGADLDGKVVAVNALRNITQFGVQAWMDKNGGQSPTVKFLEIPPPGLAAAFSTGRIDAALTAEPFMALLKPLTRIVSYAMDAISPSFTIAAYFTTADWAREHLDEVRAFQGAMRQAAAWANANHDKTAEILSRASHIDIAVIRAMTRIPFPERLVPTMIQPVIDVTARYGGGTAFPAQELVFTS